MTRARRGAAVLAVALVAAALTGCEPVTGVDAPPLSRPTSIGLKTITRPPSPSGTPRLVPTVTRQALVEPKTVGPSSTVFTTPTYTTLPSGCAAWQHQSKGNLPLSPVVGVGRASISWLYSGDPDLVVFRVTAVPEVIVGDASDTLAHLQWLDVPVDEPCRPVEMTTEVPNLVSGMPYTFWLTAHFRRHDGRDGFLDRQLGHSGSVTIG